MDGFRECGALWFRHVVEGGWLSAQTFIIAGALIFASGVVGRFGRRSSPSEGNWVDHNWDEALRWFGGALFVASLSLLVVLPIL